MNEEPKFALYNQCVLTFGLQLPKETGVELERLGLN